MPVAIFPNLMNPDSRRGGFVDICEKCRGVSVDGGELKELLAVSEAGGGALQGQRRCQTRKAYRDDHGARGYARRKKNGDGILDMFGDLFE